MRTFGVEIEGIGISIERAKNALEAAGFAVSTPGYSHRTMRTWKVVYDGSVSGGFEAVSPVLRGEEGIAEVKRAASALEAAGARINKSCGLHVHFGANDLSVAAVKNVVARYAKYESAIDAFMAPSRRNNASTYCRSVVGRVASEIVNSNASTKERLAAAMDSRYHKVNLQSLTRHGTIEFRQHGGTVDGTKIENWIRFGLAFVEKSKVLAEGGSVTVRVSGRHPRPGTKRAKIAELARQGKSAFEISNIMDLVPTNVVYHVFCLERDYPVKFRKVSLGEGDYRWEVVRWFGEENGGTENVGTGTDNGLFDGIDESVVNYYRARAASFAARSAA
jgi:hypothetical protein